MFRLMHWLTCKHKDVHRLPPPVIWPWREKTIQRYRKYLLRQLVGQELRNLSVPTPGPKDVTIG